MPEIPGRADHKRQCRAPHPVLFDFEGLDGLDGNDDDDDVPPLTDDEASGDDSPRPQPRQKRPLKNLARRGQEKRPRKSFGNDVDVQVGPESAHLRAWSQTTVDALIGDGVFLCNLLPLLQGVRADGLIFYADYSGFECPLWSWQEMEIACGAAAATGDDQWEA